MRYADWGVADDKNRALACGVVGSRVPRDRIRDSAPLSLYNECGGEGTRRPTESPREQALADDIMVLMWCVVLNVSKLDYLIPTLCIMAENGFHKKSSVEALRRQRCCKKSAARRLYELHRTLLDAIFVWTNKDGAFLDLEQIPFRILSPIYLEGHDGGEVPSQEPRNR